VVQAGEFPVGGNHRSESPPPVFMRLVVTDTKPTRTCGERTLPKVYAYCFVTAKAKDWTSEPAIRDDFGKG